VVAKRAAPRSLPAGSTRAPKTVSGADTGTKGIDSGIDTGIDMDMGEEDFERF
jgi:hypothetical protein